MHINVFEKEKYKHNTTESTRKSQILSVAADIFSCNGYSATIDQIAEKMGVTKGHIYYYFNSKQEILYEIFRQGMNFFIKEIQETSNNNFSIEERLKAVLKAHITAICENLPVMTVFMDLRKDLNPQYWKEIVNSRKEYEKLIQGLIREGIDKGIFISGEVKILSFTILGSINWVYVWYRQGGGYDMHNIAEVMSAYLVNGLKNTGEFDKIISTDKQLKIKVNDSVSFTKNFSERDLSIFEGIHGHYDLLDIKSKLNRTTRRSVNKIPEPVTASLISPVIKALLPGTEPEIRQTSYSFKINVLTEDTITIKATVSDIDLKNMIIKVDLQWRNQQGEVVGDGEISLLAPVTLSR